MIIIKNRKLLIPEYERYIGTTADSNSEVLTFRIDRYTQTEMDLSAFTAKADIYRFETEETDRADLEMEVQDNYILLYLYITSGMVAYPGTILIDIKAFNDDGTVKWSSYKGAFYVEDPFTTPQATQENLTELEQLEARINRAIATAYDKAAEVVWDWLDENIGEIEGYIIDKSLTVENAAADAKAVGDILLDADAELNATPFIAERIFRIVPEKDETGVSSSGAQCMVIVGDRIILAGRTSSDDSTQSIQEYDMSGNLIRTQAYASADLGHFSDIAYDSDRGLLYAAGTGTTIVVIRYSDLTIQETHTVTGLNRISSLTYDDGVLYGGADTYTGIIDMSTWRITPKLNYSPTQENQNIEVVRQTIAAHNGYLYIAYNRTNQLLKIDLSTWTVERSIIIGKGNGTYPYGEVEGLAFHGDRLYFCSAVWFNGHIGGTYDGGISQVFKSNIGGPLVVHSDVGQASGGYTRGVNVNASGADSTAVNPDGSAEKPFKTLIEACAYLNYQAYVNPDKVWRMTIFAGDSHDYSNDLLWLSGVTVYIYGRTGLNLKQMTLTNCTAFLRYMTSTEWIISRYSIVQMRQVTTAVLRAEYSVIYVGPSNVIDKYTLEGTTFFPYAFEDIEKSERTASPVMRFPYKSGSLTSDYLSQAMTLDRFGRTAVMSYQATFTIPANGLTTIGTLPDAFKPVRDYVYDLIDRPQGAELSRVRVYLKTTGEVQFYNYSTDRTQFTNMRLHMTYITQP